MRGIRRVRDEAEIRGHRRTYIGSMPGKVTAKMSKTAVVNPLFLLDEIDKMGMDMRGDLPAREFLILNKTIRSTITILKWITTYPTCFYLHVEFCEHSCSAVGSDGSDSFARLYRRRKAQYRALHGTSRSNNGLNKTSWRSLMVLTSR